jgi:DNA polymerase-3 subunit epsilon
MNESWNLDQPLTQVRFAVVDVETTGLSPVYGHRVCEVACLRVCGGLEEGRFESLVDPGRSISAGAFRVNRITAEMLAGAPPFDTVAEPLLELMHGAVLVAHNAPFDLAFLASELEIARLSPPEGPVVDTLALSRRVYSFARNSLSAVASALAVETPSSHRAMADARTTTHVLGRILQDLSKRWGCTSLRELLAFQGGSIPYPHARDLPLPPTIAEALEARGRVRLRYVDAAGRETHRVIRPLAVREGSGRLYLIAHCFRADALRTFRLDRVVEMVPEPTPQDLTGPSRPSDGKAAGT